MRFSKVLFGLSVALAASLTPAAAQDFPTRPITILVGLAPGGVTDVMARLYAQKVSSTLGQNVIVENRPAASGAVAAVALQKAAPDGYTLLLFSGSQHATVPALSDTAIYDPVAGAQPVAVVFNFAAVVTVPLDSPVKSIADAGEAKAGWSELRLARRGYAVAFGRREADRRDRQ